MTHDLCYLLLFNYWHWHKNLITTIRQSILRDTRTALWLPPVITRLRSEDGTSYFGDLFSTYQQVLGHPCHIWYSLGPKSLAHNHSTRAGPAKIRCVMTGVFDRKWEGCASVPKHWICFKWTVEIFANFDPWLKRMICWRVLSLRRCRIMAVHKW